MRPDTAASTERATSRALRDDFPALRQKIHGKDLVYLDSAATALKPQAVIDAIVNAYAKDSANVHRGVHLLSQRASAAYEGAREKVAKFLDANETEEIVFTAGTTDAINLVARGWAEPRLGPGDTILITGLEHHSNLVPWQVVRDRTGARLEVVPVTDEGEVRLEDFEARLDASVKLVAVSHASNTLGTVLPIREITARAHAVGAKVLVDGAQAVPHLPVSVRELDCDFYAFSGHKLYGPTGVGVLYGRRALLEETDPARTGGGMIRSVTFDKTTYAPLPERFDAGTPHIAGVIGLGAAIDYVLSVGFAEIVRHERALLAYGQEALSTVPGLRVIGTARDKIGVLSFVMSAAHPHDIGTVLDAAGVAIRTGHHCTQPLMARFAVPATARASIGLYNTREDLDALVSALYEVQEMFA